MGANGASGTPPSNCPSENCSNRKRDGTILTQGNAPQELKMFSQARGASLSRLPSYAYDSMGGRGITVYIIDSGITPNHPVSAMTDYQIVDEAHELFPGIQKYAGKHTLALSTR
jgi:hypothetical protein